MPGPRRPLAPLGACALAVALALGSGAAADGGGSSFEERHRALVDAVRRGEKPKLTFGSLTTIEAYITDLRRNGTKFHGYRERMTRLVAELLDAAEGGRDVIAQKRGMFWRGYESRYSYFPQLYSIYVPTSYDGSKPLPLVVSLHGGHSNHNVWLAMNLGNILTPPQYRENFRSEFRAVKQPKAIVVAPDGLGEIRWRWAGEQDVLDVIADAKANYNIDPDKVVLTGLSNGGIGSYTLGLKRASEFSAVLPLAGVVDWLNHHEAQGHLRPSEKRVLMNESAITYAENAQNTYLRFFHGKRDSGFSVEQARSLKALLERLRIPFVYQEFGNLGHDLTHILWRTLLVDDIAKKQTRQKLPAHVRVATASPRATRQHWLSLDERIDHTRPARVDAIVVGGGRIVAETDNAERVAISFAGCPVSSPVTVRIDGWLAYAGPIPKSGALAFALEFAPGRAADDASGAATPVWREWDGALPQIGTRKAGLVVGPLGDVNYETQVHVYGTLVPEDIPMLRRAAQLGGRGWLAAWDYTEIRYPVIPDTELTAEMIRDNAVFLYGNARNNAVLARIGKDLPIGVGEGSLTVRGEKLEGDGVGARFVCPNPLAPDRYLVVAAGTTAEAVERGGRLPIYLSDYIIYDGETTQRKAFMILGGRPEIETGFFTEGWRLPPPPDGG
jgi:predicted esterase